MSATCPYCEPQLGYGWGMAAETWERFHKWHDAGHPKEGPLGLSYRWLNPVEDQEP